MENKIKVIELFAGIGGFRIGLEGYNDKSSTSDYKEDINSNYKVVWSNQYEPTTKIQHANIIYKNNFGEENHSTIDINDVNIDEIPDHDMLVAGFPCQDYSVANSLKTSQGITGKKGVLWWNIYNILNKKRSKYVLLENVDRLLSSPASQRGRDFGMILASLNELNYIVEWRVINAAEYGFPQRRKRTYILAYQKNTYIYDTILKSNFKDWLIDFGTFADAFPISNHGKLKDFEIEKDILSVYDNFSNKFENCGIMYDRLIITTNVTPQYDGKFKVLNDIIEKDNISDEFFVSDEELTKWEYLKGSKNIKRITKDGFEYDYKEGGMTYPDDLNKPSRTIITSEGGKTPSRFKHIININNKHRRLTPLELERLSMFPDNFTKDICVSDSKRAYFIGNALVIGVIEKISKSLEKKIL